jgi:hypothetical protein
VAAWEERRKGIREGRRVEGGMMRLRNSRTSMFEAAGLAEVERWKWRKAMRRLCRASATRGGMTWAETTKRRVGMTQTRFSEWGRSLGHLWRRRGSGGAQGGMIWAEAT